MDFPLVNILVRSSYRPSGFRRLYESILSQSYPNIRVICSYDDERALSYLPESVDKVRVFKNDQDFFYDGYVNDLKALVSEGWFIVVDEDDYLIDSECILKLSEHFEACSGIICQFSRSGRIKPSNELIRNRSILRAKIGMPCLVLHHSKKNVAHLDGRSPAADYAWIKEVSKRVNLKFAPAVVVYSPSRGFGAMES